MAILPLQLDSVCFAPRGQALITDVSMTLEDGERTVILGHNGAGKSLLLRLFHGLLRPTSGTLRWTGTDGADAQRRQAMVFQRPIMLRRSVSANVAYGLKLRRIPRARRATRIAEMLARTGLEARAAQPASTLSGGEQQRLALARAWALAPEVLFLDEPTASLDPGGTAAVEAIIGEIHRSGTKIVMTTHDIGQARRLSDRVAFVHTGRIAEYTPAQKFFEAPESDAAAAFLAGRLIW